MNEGTIIRTGIKGLDEILQGGIPRANTILVEGETGSGKTLFGMEFIYRGITEFDELSLGYRQIPAKREFARELADGCNQKTLLLDEA